MNEQEPIRIIIHDEDVPLKADKGTANNASIAKDASKKLAVVAKDAAQKAWKSDSGRKVAKKLQEATDSGVRYMGTRVADAAEAQAKQRAADVQNRIKETDWQVEAKSGLVTGMKWLSGQIGELAQRLTPDADESQEKSPSDVE
jgi:hypothetical protein